MTDGKDPRDAQLEAYVPESRRGVLKVILGGAAVYSVPVLSSFSMGGLSFDAALAQGTNMPNMSNMPS